MIDLIWLIYLTIGLIAGAVPGISPTLALAIALPFSFSMNQPDALSFLTILYVSSVAGGMFSAIYLGIPGAPANIATLLDSSNLRKEGHADGAAVVGTLASALGGILGFIALYFLLKILAPFLLSLNTYNIAAIALSSLLFIIFSEKNYFAMASGCFVGSILSMIGIDNITGKEFLILVPEMEQGINIIILMLAAFGFPAAYEMLTQNKKTEQFNDNCKLSSLFLISLKNSLNFGYRIWMSGISSLIFFISSVIGIFIGILPGLGGQVAGIVSHKLNNLWLNGFKIKSNFGDGDPRGVLASETSNSSMVGASLLPLLTLSIPGSPTAAVFLGGMLIHGVFPSINFFSNQFEAIKIIVLSGILSSLILIPIGILAGRFFVKLISLPSDIIGLFVIFSCICGSYFSSNSSFGIVLFIFLSILMFTLYKLKVSLMGVIMGFVIWPHIYNNYRYASMMDQNFFSNYLNILIVFLIIFFLTIKIFLSFKKHKR